MALFTDGFESGNFNAWDGDTTGGGAVMEVVSNTSHEGTYSAHFSVPSGSWATIYEQLPSSYTTLYVREYVKLNETPASGDAVTMMGIFSGSPSDANTIAVAGLHNDGGTPYWMVKWRDGSTLTKSLSSEEAITGSYHCIELKGVVDGTNGEIELWVNGTSVLSLTGKDTDAVGNASHVSAECGTWGEGSSGEDWVDSFEVSESYIGLKSLNINVSESISVNESVDTSVITSIEISESINITENISADIFYHEINVFDNVTVAENIIVDIQTVSTLSISVSDQVNVAENINVLVKEVPILGIGIIDFDVSSQIVGFWKMNEDSWNGTIDEIIDSSGNNHHGVGKPTNGGYLGPTTIFAKLDRGGQLDGINDYVDLGSDAGLNLTTALTFELWARPHTSQEICYTAETGGNTGLAAKVESNEGSANWSWQLRYGSDDACRLGFQANNSDGGTVWVTAGQDLTSNEWQHIVITFDGTNLKFYLNGSEVDNNTVSGNISSYANSLLIGSEGWSGVTDYFDGDIDNVRLFDSALSGDEVKALYNGGAGTEALSGHSDSISVTEDVTVSVETVPTLSVNVNDSVSVAEDVTVSVQAVTASSIDVNDSVTVSEDITVTVSALPDLSIDVNEAITVSENIIIQSKINLNVSDSVTVNENIVTLLDAFIDVLDSITVAESVVTLLINRVSVFDAISVSEDITVSVLKTNITIDVYDSVAVSENIQTSLENYVDVNDAITVAEKITVALTGFVNVNETVAVSENISALLTGFINVSEAIAVSENVTVLLPFLNVSVNEAITVQESVTARLNNFVEVLEEITVSESIDLTIPVDVEVSDSVVVTENVSVLLSFYNIDVSEAITVNESVEVAIGYFLSVFDEIAVSENIETSLISNVETNEAITVAENIKLSVSNLVNVYDAVAVSESISLFIASQIVVFDAITVTEQVQVSLSAPTVNVFDTVGLTENVSASVDLYMDVNESIAVAEAITAIRKGLFIDVNEAITVTDVPTVQPPEMFIDVSENITVSEFIDVLRGGDRNIEVSDSITVAEWTRLLVSAGPTDTYCVYGETGNHLSIFVDGVEVARFKDNGNVELSGTITENAF